jgi:hypothetical protein
MKFYEDIFYMKLPIVDRLDGIFFFASSVIINFILNDRRGSRGLVGGGY